ncbi:MAG: DUF11 domain-containing protein [Micrococcales bacterium]|nr:DUF11 domain-containing protein [Micrococcales bacterium]
MRTGTAHRTSTVPVRTLVPAVATGIVGGLLAVTTALMGTTSALWTEDVPLALGGGELTLEYPQDVASFELKTTMSATRTTVPGLGDDEDEYPAPMTYTVRVDNLGPDEATNMTVTINVPLVEHLSFVATRSPDIASTCDTTNVAVEQGQVTTDNQEVTHAYGQIVCTVPGPLAAGNGYELHVDMSASQLLAKSELLATTTVDAAGSQQTASWLMSSPKTLIDLSLHKTGPASIEAGKIGVYTLTVKNETVGAETSVAAPPVVVDTLPPGVTFLVSKSPTWCTVAGDPSEGQVVTCDFSAAGRPVTIASGAEFPLELSVQFDESLAGTTITNTATVSSTDPDPSLANNTWSATTVVTDGSGNESVFSCPDGYYYNMFAGGCVEVDPSGGGEPEDSEFHVDVTSSPKWDWLTVNPNNPFVYTPFTLTLPFSPVDDKAVVTVSLGSAWSNFANATNDKKNLLGQTNTPDNKGVLAWQIDFQVNGKTVTPNTDGTYTIVLDDLSSGLVVVELKIGIKFVGQGNDSTVITPTIMAAHVETTDINGEQTWFVVGGIQVPGYLKDKIANAPKEPSGTWWPTDQYPGYFYPPEAGEEPESGAQPIVLAAAPLSSWPDIEASEDGEQAGEPDTEDDLAETETPLLLGGSTTDGDTIGGVFDPDAMMFTREDGTVLVVVSVEEVDGTTVVTTEDGTQFVSDSSDSTWVQVVAED